MQAATAAFNFLLAMALICVALGGLAWARRKCADWRGHRLPPTRWL